MILYVSIGMGLLLSWCVIILAPGFKDAYDDRDLPQVKKRGVSIYPGIPFMPIFVGIIAFLSNRYLSTWIAIGILAVNAAVAAWALVYGVYWLRKWRKSPNQSL